MATCPRTPNTTPRANASPSSRAASASWRAIIPSVEVIDVSQLSGDQVTFGAQGHHRRRGKRGGEDLPHRRPARGRHEERVDLDLLAARQGADGQEGGRQRSRCPPPAAPAPSRSPPVAYRLRRQRAAPARLRRRGPSRPARAPRRSPRAGHAADIRRGAHRGAILRTPTIENPAVPRRRRRVLLKLDNLQAHRRLQGTRRGQPAARC